MSHANLNRRAILAGAAAFPALALPALASTSASACTLPPDLIERFVRLRAWYLDFEQRDSILSDEIDRRFYAATGLTSEQWRGVDLHDPRREGLNAIHGKICGEVSREDNESECNRLVTSDGVLPKLFLNTSRKPSSISRGRQAWLIADLEIYSEPPGLAMSDRLIRTLFNHIRMLAALPQPYDPLGLLSISIESDDEAVQS